MSAPIHSAPATLHSAALPEIFSLMTGRNGMWYQDAPRRGIDAFDTFMHDVGRAAFVALTTAERECITAMQPTAATT